MIGQGTEYFPGNVFRGKLRKYFPGNGLKENGKYFPGNSVGKILTQNRKNIQWKRNGKL